MCFPGIREADANYLSSRKHRGDQDQSVSTDVSFGQVLIEEAFGNDSFVVARPSVMDSEDHDPEGKVDPNGCNYSGKDVKWVLETWT